jgi:hypothetical protein
MGWDSLREIVYGLVPTAGVVLVFYLVIRAILRADESERQAAREFGDGLPPQPSHDSPEASRGNADGHDEQDSGGGREGA